MGQRQLQLAPPGCGVPVRPRSGDCFDRFATDFVKKFVVLEGVQLQGVFGWVVQRQSLFPHAVHLVFCNLRDYKVTCNDFRRKTKKDESNVLMNSVIGVQRFHYLRISQ